MEAVGQWSSWTCRRFMPPIASGWQGAPGLRPGAAVGAAAGAAALCLLRGRAFEPANRTALAGLFVEVLRLCAEAGLAPSGVVALDGTKLRANASREAQPHGGAVGGRSRAHAGRSGAERTPTNRRVQAGSGATRCRQNCAAGRSGWRGCGNASRRMHAGPNRSGRRPDPETKVNLSDPDSRVVRDYWGHYQGYNAQAVATPRAGHRGGGVDPRGDRCAGAGADGRGDESQSGGAGSGADRDLAGRRRLLLRRQRPGRWPRLGPSC